VNRQTCVNLSQTLSFHFAILAVSIALLHYTCFNQLKNSMLTCKTLREYLNVIPSSLLPPGCQHRHGYQERLSLETQYQLLKTGIPSCMSNEKMVEQIFHINVTFMGENIYFVFIVLDYMTSFSK